MKIRDLIECTIDTVGSDEYDTCRNFNKNYYEVSLRKTWLVINQCSITTINLRTRFAKFKILDIKKD